MKSGAKIISGDTIGSWGCLCCHATMPNNHSGPCSLCGGPIGRVLPNAARHAVDLGGARSLRGFVPEVVETPKQDWTNVALVAAAVSCFAAPMLGASNAGWSAVAAIMALNIWSSSVSYYALAIVGRGGR